MIESALLEELKASHPRLYTIDIGEHTIAFACDPKTFRARYKRFISTVVGDKQKAPTAQEDFALDCIVHPSREAFVEILNEHPGAAAKVANELMKIASGDEVDAAKKA